jgi:hypothetical protein
MIESAITIWLASHGNKRHLGEGKVRTQRLEMDVASTVRNEEDAEELGKEHRHPTAISCGKAEKPEESEEELQGTGNRHPTAIFCAQGGNEGHGSATVIQRRF